MAKRRPPRVWERRAHSMPEVEGGVQVAVRWEKVGRREAVIPRAARAMGIWSLLEWDCGFGWWVRLHLLGPFEQFER